MGNTQPREHVHQPLDRAPQLEQHVHQPREQHVHQQREQHVHQPLDRAPQHVRQSLDRGPQRVLEAGQNTQQPLPSNSGSDNEEPNELPDLNEHENAGGDEVQQPQQNGPENAGDPDVSQ